MLQKALFITSLVIALSVMFFVNPTQSPLLFVLLANVSFFIIFEHFLQIILNKFSIKNRSVSKITAVSFLFLLTLGAIRQASKLDLLIITLLVILLSWYIANLTKYKTTFR